MIAFDDESLARQSIVSASQRAKLDALVKHAMHGNLSVPVQVADGSCGLLVDGGVARMFPPGAAISRGGDSSVASLDVEINKLLWPPGWKTRDK
ncbi:hypothetical protein EC912_10529 [Luteibacter rhizovicinus]|uniref:Uncharacterized protein n=2 Tax=Luteibacter rhizovicinus TaxID=242606 RepID=A0A4V2W3S9_9GAMM|nr:hypothetical protein EC912_10529 [Luteibacter rhizovicinus]